MSDSFLSRRHFLRTAAGAVLSTGALGTGLGQDITGRTGAGESILLGARRLPRRSYRKDTPNLLLVSIDDLNDWVGYLGGHPLVQTPHLDAFAAGSLAFERAYCSVAMCLPSRASMLTGLSPATTGLLGRNGEYNETGSKCRDEGICHERIIAETETLVDTFWADGYQTAGAGKVFHGGHGHRFEKYADTSLSEARTAYIASLPDDSYVRKVAGLQWGKAPDGRRQDHYDYKTVSWCADQIASYEKQRSGRPWFLACGVSLPHLPWIVPEHYWRLYKTGDIEPMWPVSRAEMDLLDVPEFARRHIVQPKTAYKLRDTDREREAIHAYLAAISFVDAEFGRLMRALNASAFAANTIVVLWSDHGWHLGEKLRWHKMTLWEQGTRIPYAIRVPGDPRFSPGSRYSLPISLMDTYPTLCELTGIAIPGHVDGKSILPQLENADIGVNRPAIMYWEPGNTAVRWKHYRYIEYRDGSRELYDLQEDPDELTNLAFGPAVSENHRDVMNKCAEFIPRDRLAKLTRSPVSPLGTDRRKLILE